MHLTPQPCPMLREVKKLNIQLVQVNKVSMTPVTKMSGRELYNSVDRLNTNG